jgi:hypothetical protein
MTACVSVGIIVGALLTAAGIGLGLIGTEMVGIKLGDDDPMIVR